MEQQYLYLLLWCHSSSRKCQRLQYRDPEPTIELFPFSVIHRPITECIQKRKSYEDVNFEYRAVQHKLKYAEIPLFHFFFTNYTNTEIQKL